MRRDDRSAVRLHARFLPWSLGARLLVALTTMLLPLLVATMNSVRFLDQSHRQGVSALEEVIAKTQARVETRRLLRGPRRRLLVRLRPANRARPLTLSGCGFRSIGASHGFSASVEAAPARRLERPSLPGGSLFRSRCGR